MKAVKCQDGGSLGPKRKKKGAPQASLNFAPEGPIPNSCKGDRAPATGAAAGGSGITVNRGSSGNSRASQQAGTLGSKKQFDRGRVVTAKALERQREKKAKQEKKDRLRSMTRGERKAAEQKAKDQRYAGPRFL
jgi:hypothetical protein